MKAGILKYPGGHGDTELFHCVTAYFRQEATEVWYADDRPFDFDILFIGGGFPCNEDTPVEICLGDSPALRHLYEFAASGKYVIALNKGFQLLCKMELLPGSLKNNPSQKFLCRHIYIKPDNHRTLMTEYLNKEEVYYIPVATYQGKYYADEEELASMRQEGQILFRYCDHEGRITESVNYMDSTDNIAGICNRDKNVFGLIPQPERALFGIKGNGDGYRIMDAFLNGIVSRTG